MCQGDNREGKLCVPNSSPNSKQTESFNIHCLKIQGQILGLTQTLSHSCFRISICVIYQSCFILDKEVHILCPISCSAQVLGLSYRTLQNRYFQKTGTTGAKVDQDTVFTLVASKAFAIYLSNQALFSLHNYSLTHPGSLLGIHPNIAPFLFKLVQSM